MKKILLGVTGSVGAIKLPEIITKLKATDTTNKNMEIKVIATHHALEFLPENMAQEVGVQMIIDEDEWRQWKKKGDPVMHIDLCRWADVFIILPLDANTLTKIATGICDNLLTCVARAWRNFDRMIAFPAMNSYMWSHPITSHQINILKSWGIVVVDPIEKRLACGDYGIGALAEPDDVVKLISNYFCH